MMLLSAKLNEKALLPSLLGLPLVRLGFKRLDVSARLAAVGATIGDLGASERRLFPAYLTEHGFPKYRNGEERLSGHER
jgi:hypothetical protein